MSGGGVGAGRLFEAESGFDLAGGVGAFAFVDGAGLEKVEVVVTDAFAMKERGTASRCVRLPNLLEDAGLLFGVAFTVHFSSYGRVWQKFLPAGREKRRRVGKRQRFLDKHGMNI